MSHKIRKMVNKDIIHNHKFIEHKSIKILMIKRKQHNKEGNEDIEKNQVSEIKNFLDDILSRVVPVA